MFESPYHVSRETVPRHLERLLSRGVNGRTGSQLSSIFTVYGICVSLLTFEASEPSRPCAAILSGPEAARGPGRFRMALEWRPEAILDCW